MLIKAIGAVRACLVQLAGVRGLPLVQLRGVRFAAVLMAYVLLVTGSGGWMFSYAFAQTRSLYASTGLHLGWNLVAAVVFSSGPIGSQLLLQQGEARRVERVGHPALLLAAGHRRARGGDLVPDARLPPSGGSGALTSLRTVTS